MAADKVIRDLEERLRQAEDDLAQAQDSMRETGLEELLEKIHKLSRQCSVQPDRTMSTGGAIYPRTNKRCLQKRGSLRR